MTGAARLLPLLALLAGCIEFVDPVGLKLARATRVEVGFDLADGPARAACADQAPAAADSAVLCFTARIDPGYTPLGERLRVLGDTLVALGVPIAPTVDENGVLRYQRRFALSAVGLESIPFTVWLPRVEGAADFLPRQIRWFAAGPGSSDSLTREPGEGVRFEVALPGGVSSPAPLSAFWSMDLRGDTATATYNGSGIPRPAYDFPAEVLAALGGSGLRGELRWLRSRSVSSEDLVLDLRFNQRLGWRVETRAPAVAGSRRAGTNPSGRVSHTHLTGGRWRPRRGGGGAWIRSDTVDTVHETWK